MSTTDGFAPKPPGRVRGRPFEKGRSGNPLGRRVGCRNKTTIAAATLLAGEAEALTRKGVELALVGDPTAMLLGIERIPAAVLPPHGQVRATAGRECPHGSSPWAKGPRHRRRGEGGYLGARRRHDHAGHRGGVGDA